MSPMTAQHLARQEGGYEPQRDYNGQLLIFGLEGWNTPNSYVTLSLEAFDLPAIDVGTTEMYWMGQCRKTAGNVRFDDIEITVRDFVDKATTSLMWRWIQQVHNNVLSGVFGDVLGFLSTPVQSVLQIAGLARTPPPGGRGRAKNYKKFGIAALISTDGSYQRAYYLHGIWPKRFIPGRVDYESDDILKGTLILSVDTAEYIGGATAIANLMASPAEFAAGLI